MPDAPTWWVEEGIGENRAVLVADGAIVEAVIELPGKWRAGAVAEARLTAVQQPGRRGLVTLPDWAEALLEPIPPGATEGALVRVEVVRAALAEAGPSGVGPAEAVRSKRAVVRPTDASPRPAPSLAQRIGAARPTVPGDADPIEAAGWSALLEEASSGEIAFRGGALRMSLTPAMTLFDVDGVLPPAALAIAGAAAAGRAIRRLDVGGSIGVDLPTLSAKADRQAAAAALDTALPQPFERTAVNGFGFLQIVRRRSRPSIAEIVAFDPVGAAARALLRRGERAGGGALTLTAAPPVIDRLAALPDWLFLLERRSGGAVALRADPRLAISAGHAHRHQTQP